MVGCDGPQGRHSLHVASCYMHTPIVKLLLQTAADVSMRNAAGFTPLHVTESRECCELLVEFGADVMAADKKGRTSLFCAAAQHRMECVQYFCGIADMHPRMISLADHRGDTPLHAAACNGHADVIRLLLECAAKQDAKNVRGLTPLELAEHNGQEECVGLLRPAQALAPQPASALPQWGR